MVQELGSIVAKPSERGQFTGRFRVEIPATGQVKPRGSIVFRGGGGRARPTTGSILDTISQQEALDEVQRQATIQSELTAKAEQERQDTIQAGTIAGQLKGGSPSMISATPDQKGISARLREQVSFGETAGLRGQITPVQRLKTGAASAALVLTQLPAGLFGLGRGLVTQPIQTVKAIPGGLVSSVKEIGLQLASPTPEVGVGRIIGEVALFKGTSAIPKGVTKGVDVFRTRGLKEIPVEKIVAPEFFKGQTFPQIKKGTTAKELLEEFTTVLPGETKAGGFTASPKPFKKLTEAQRGTSEFPGVFQAPKVSPRFLRVGGEAESKLFSLDIFDTLRPSVVRTTPEKFRIAPAIDPSLPRIQPGTAKATRKFFETAPKGESIVTFIKTEKEAIIPFGTTLEQTGKRFFFKFEGRRVPIFEFKTTGKVVSKLDDFKAPPTIEGVSSSFGRGVSRRGKVTPLSSVPSSTLISRDFSLPSVSRPRARGRKVESSLGRLDFVGGPSTGRGGVSSFPDLGGTSSRGDFGIDVFRGVPVVSRPTTPKFDFETPLQRPLRKRKSDDRKRKKEKIKDIKKRRKEIRPSFTAITLDIKTGLPKESKLIGINPFDIRGL